MRKSGIFTPQNTLWNPTLEENFPDRKKGDISRRYIVIDSDDTVENYDPIRKILHTNDVLIYTSRDIPVDTTDSIFSVPNFSFREYVEDVGMPIQVSDLLSGNTSAKGYIPFFEKYIHAGENMNILSYDMYQIPKICKEYANTQVENIVSATKTNEQNDMRSLIYILAKTI
jgi:hypothetical protein